MAEIPPNLFKVERSVFIKTVRKLRLRRCNVAFPDCSLHAFKTPFQSWEKSPNFSSKVERSAAIFHVREMNMSEML